MTDYYIKSCYIKNRTAYIMAVLGCINREVNKLDKEFWGKRKDFGEALSGFAHTLLTALNVENDPKYAIGMYDCLEVTLLGTYYSKVQEKADEVIKLLEDDITIHFTGPFGNITTEYEEWLPDFKGKIIIKVE